MRAKELAMSAVLSKCRLTHLSKHAEYENHRTCEWHFKIKAFLTMSAPWVELLCNTITVSYHRATSPPSRINHLLKCSCSGVPELSKVETLRWCLLSCSDMWLICLLGISMRLSWLALKDYELFIQTFEQCKSLLMKCQWIVWSGACAEEVNQEVRRSIVWREVQVILG